MTFCLFLTLPAALADAELHFLPEHTRVYTPERAHDPYLDDGAAPPMVLQLYFDSLRELEASPRRLMQVVRSCEAQAMAVRRFAVPEATIGRNCYCTYLVT